MGTELSDEPERQSAFSRVCHSIRTRCSLATAAFLLVVLLVFYIGGRIVLVHLMRDAEDQVRDIGLDISRIAYRNAERAKRSTERHASAAVEMLSADVAPESLFDKFYESGLALVAVFKEDGTLMRGAIRSAAGDQMLDAEDLAPYSDRIANWVKAEHDTPASSVGIVQLKGSPFYMAMMTMPDGRVAMLGTAFSSSIFSAQVNDGFAGVGIKITDRKSVVERRPSKGSAPGGSQFGLTPMLSEALNFYSGGFWRFDQNPFEAVFAVRDISGNAITMISVSLPQTLSNVTRSALGRFTFFISIAGIFIVLPVFWFQGIVLLNPLSKMTEAIRRLGEHHRDTDCPRLEWNGKDEFAMLALSVNRMLETITERTVKIAQVESRHRALIYGLPDALAVFDRRGRLVAVNKQPEGTPPLPGMVPGEAPSAEAFGEDGAKAVANAVSAVFETSSVQTVRLESCRGESRNFEVRITRMDEMFALAIVRDVTRETAEHKLRLAAEARAVDASKRESLTLLAAGIAHDVNNVLSVILNTVESAAAESGSGLDVVAIRDAVMRGSRMTKELMAFAGDNKVSLVRASPDFFVKDVQPLVSHVVGDNVSISYSLAEGLPDVDADPNQFWKILFNIVKNAGEAIGDRQGHITISTSAFEMTDEVAVEFLSEHPLPPGKGVIFEVADDGPGVKAELLSRLFDPYVSSRALGRGLGLATVRSIVEAHGGGIRVQSEVDRGTRFGIYLPASWRESVSQSALVQRKHGDLPQEVLVVDNDESILKTCSVLLKAMKMGVHVARNRQESLGILRRKADDIGAILLDVHLGGIDTVRLLDAFRVAAPKTVVVVSSGSNEEAVEKLFEGHPYDAFLAKPYTISELKAALAASRREA